MNKYTKLPLYLGMIILVGSVILSVITLGEKNNLTYHPSKAASSDVSLNLNFLPPNKITVSLASKKEVSGIDMAIKYDRDVISILPSTFQNGPDFINAGASINEDNNLLLLTVLPNRQGITSGIIGSFEVQAVDATQKIETEIDFETADNKTTVLDNTSQNNILGSAQGVKIILLP